MVNLHPDVFKVNCDIFLKEEAKETNEAKLKKREKAKERARRCREARKDEANFR